MGTIRGLVVVGLVALAGCGDNLAAMHDAAATCESAANGTRCGDAMICIGGVCEASRCGDGFVDQAAAEQCDDGNASGADGCEPNCRFTCASDEDCADAEPCNGAETCDLSTHTCAGGTALANGTACSTSSRPNGVCRAQVCVATGCGNGVVDGNEQCDDMNVTPGDGCEVDCTYTCTNDAMCADGNVCNGMETCNVVAHTCLPGSPPTCSDNNNCTTDSCDAVNGCQYVLVDQDGDGYAPMSLGSCGTDCNDGNPGISPAATEVFGDATDTDENCDMVIGCYADGDDDGYRTMMTLSSADADCNDAGEARAAEPAGDCNDASAAISPGDPEIADNGIDDNCSGFYGCYFDADNDGFSRSDGAIRDDSVDADCADSGEGASSEPRTDCDDSNASVSPGSAEVADNGLDDNCSGLYGCYFDADNDGYSRSDAAIRDDSVDADCADSGEGASTEPRTDCNDTNAAISPGGPEIPDNGIDDNCSGLYGCYFDADNDGFSRSDGAVRDDSADTDCADSGEGASSEPRTDCNDMNAAISPGSAEVADNGADDNCSGLYGCYFDADNDGFSRSDGAIRDDSVDADCADNGEGASTEPRTDCNDTNAGISPGAPEIADNGLDDNCNGLYSCYFDVDNDGFSRSDGAVRDDSLNNSCADSGEGAASEPRTDCNDSNAGINPGAREICSDAIDQNCTAGADETSQCPACSWNGQTRFLSHGLDGGCAFQTGVHVSCNNGRISNMQLVIGGSCPIGFVPAQGGTGDTLVGCDWLAATRWVTTGNDGNPAAFLNGSSISCSAVGVVTNFSFEGTTGAIGTFTPGDLGCNWSGAIWLSHGWDGLPCQFTSGVAVTCFAGRITNIAASVGSCGWSRF